MDTQPKRDSMRETAYEWCLANVEQFFDRFNQTLVDADAKAEYHGMVDAIVWSDEMPDGSGLELGTLQKVFCVLSHSRTSLILGETISARGMELMDRVREACPHWSFNQLERNSDSRVADYENVRQRFFGKLDQLSDSSAAKKNDSPEANE